MFTIRIDESKKLSSILRPLRLFFVLLAVKKLLN
jgi:hypothetical protein